SRPQHNRPAHQPPVRREDERARLLKLDEDGRERHAEHRHAQRQRHQQIHRPLPGQLATPTRPRPPPRLGGATRQNARYWSVPLQASWGGAYANRSTRPPLCYSCSCPSVWVEQDTPMKAASAAVPDAADRAALEDDAVSRIFWMARAVRTATDQMLAPFGVTAQQWVVLRCCCDRGEITPTELADTLNLD